MNTSGSLRQRTLAALLWSGVGEYVSTAIRLAALLALAWLLPPSDFGLLALATVFILIAEGVGELGLGAALVQRETLQATHSNTVFWAVLCTNISLALATCWIARPLAAFLGDPAAAELLQLLALGLPVHALTVVPQAHLRRSLGFRQLSMAQFAGETAYALVGVALAASGFGFWSLGGAVLARRLLILIVTWSAAGWRPRLFASFSDLRSLWGFGAPFMASSVLDRVVLNLDFFVVGRWLGSEALGYYSVAFQLALNPLARCVQLVNQVSFPAFSRVQTETKRLASALLEGLRHVVTLTLLLGGAVLLLGPTLIETLYGAKWQPSIGPLLVLAIGGIVGSLRLAESALLALGKPRMRLALSALRLSVLAVLLTVGVRYGIGGVAAGVAGALAISGLAALLLAMRSLAIPAGSALEALRYPARGLAAALAPVALLPFLPEDAAPAKLAIGIVALLVYLCLTAPGLWAEVAAARKGSRVDGSRPGP